jgi:hypothetical protein
MTDGELIEHIEAQRSLMIAVATGGPKIQEVNREYIQRRRRIAAELQRRGLRDPNPHLDLWAWYGRWSAGDMPSYNSRRLHLSALYEPLIEQVTTGREQPEVAEPEPTGWPRVDRGIYEIRRRLEQAQNEEQFQAVGLLCREVLVSAGQEVYDPFFHATEDGVEPSGTDVKRMLDAFIGFELGGSSAEEARRYARSALSLANDLQHRRTATFRHAALCVEATISVVNIVAILSGRRDRQAQ